VSKPVIAALTAARNPADCWMSRRSTCSSAHGGHCGPEAGSYLARADAGGVRSVVLAPSNGTGGALLGDRTAGDFAVGMMVGRGLPTVNFRVRLPEAGKSNTALVAVSRVPPCR